MIVFSFLQTFLIVIALIIYYLNVYYTYVERGKILERKKVKILFLIVPVVTNVILHSEQYKSLAWSTTNRYHCHVNVRRGVSRLFTSNSHHTDTTYFGVIVNYFLMNRFLIRKNCMNYRMSLNSVVVGTAPRLLPRPTAASAARAARNATNRNLSLPSQRLSPTRTPACPKVPDSPLYPLKKYHFSTRGSMLRNALWRFLKDSI